MDKRWKIGRRQSGDRINIAIRKKIVVRKPTLWIAFVLFAWASAARADVGLLMEQPIGGLTRSAQPGTYPFICLEFALHLPLGWVGATRTKMAW